MTKTVVVLRWTGRIWSLGSLALLVSLALGSRETPTASELVGLALFPGGVAAGMLIGWRKEGLGGATTILSLSAFYLWSMATRGLFPNGPWFLLVAAPGPIFLVCALLQEIQGPSIRSQSPGT